MAWNKAISLAHSYWSEEESSCYQRRPQEEDKDVTPPTNHLWQTSEDKRLEKLVTKFNFDWEKIAESFPGKSLEAVRTRWTRHLSPNTNSQDWTSHEDSILISLVKAHGENWNAISLFMREKSIPSIVQRYQQLKERSEKNQIDRKEQMGSLIARLECLQEIVRATELEISRLQKY